LNAWGTEFWNCWKTASRLSLNRSWLSPSWMSWPEWECSRIASGRPQASTRVVLPLKTSGPMVNSMKS